MLWKRLAMLNTAIIGLIVAVMCFFSIRMTNDLIYNEQSETCDRVISLGTTSMSDFFSTLKSRTLGLAINDELQMLMEQVGSGAGDALLSDQHPRFGRVIRTTFFDANHVTVELYAPNSNGEIQWIDYTDGVIRLEPATEEIDWYFSAVSEDGAFHWAVIENGGVSSLRIIKAVRSIADHATVLGVITVDIPASVLISELYSMQLHGTLTAYLTDELGTALFLTQTLPSVDTKIYLGNSNACDLAKTGETVYVRQSGLYGLRLVWVFDPYDFSQRMIKNRNTILLIGVLLIALSLALSATLSRQISIPLTHLSRQMRQRDRGALSQIPLPVGHPPKEIRQLYSSFNEMAANEERLTHEIIKSELKAKDAELRSLQAQINPHFLYNVLNSISWMTVRYGASDIRETVQALSKMLRYSLNSGEQMISVRDEIEQVKNYIFIMQHRFPGVFTVDYDVDIGTEGLTIPKLMLQPLAENAINHGFSDMAHGGHLLIRVAKESCGTVFYVKNNGTPFDLERVTRALYPLPDETPTSYGLRNVNDRLIERYGEAFKLKCYVENGISVFTFVIPDPKEE